MQMSRTHLFIPDLQIKPDIPTDHLTWIGKYIVDKKPDHIINAGDHFDLPSMSYFDKGKNTSKFEGRRYRADVQAGFDGLDLLEAPMVEYNDRMRSQKMKQYLPQKDITWGNHEYRIERYIERAGELEGLLGMFEFDDYFQARGWTTHDFLKVVEIDGVWYSHYFYNPLSGRPWGGLIKNRLDKIGHSFTQGHTQTCDHGMRYVGNRQQHGIVAGSCYLHFEDFKGYQGNYHWRGIIVKHEVKDGSYDPMFVSLNYLCIRYEGVPLAEFMMEKYGVTV
jgi:hypothetical protein